MYDLIMIGAGPASLTAAIYALRYNLNILILGGIPGGLMMETHKICNWPGEIGITGYELSGKMKAQVEEFGGKFAYDLVTAIKSIDGGWEIVGSGTDSYTAKTVIYALGTEHRHLGIAAEDKYKGKGVAYCATCDAMFYKGKVTAVVGGGNSAMTSALYLADLCPQVYLISRGSELKGEVSWMKEVAARSNIVYLPNTNVIDLAGEDKLAEIILDKPYNGSDRLAVDGLFVEIGLNPKSEIFAAAGGEINEARYIKVAADMSTNLLGLFAAGDATNGSNGFRQIVTAVAEGAIAADSAFKYIKSR